MVSPPPQPTSASAHLTGTTVRSTRRRVSWVLLAVLLLAAVVRFHGIDFGLPHTRVRPDETKVVRILESPWEGFHPRTFAYPSLHKYMVLGLDGLHYLAGRASGEFESLADLMAAYALEPGVFYLLDRMLVATLGTLSVWVLYRLGRRVGGRTTGLVAATFLSLAYLHVRDSHFGVTDVPMLFFILLSADCILRAHETGRTRDYLLGGLFCGLATSTKYAGAFLVVPLAWAHLSVLRREGASPWRGLLDRRTLGFAGLALVAFFAGTPYALLDVETFLRDVARDAKHLAEGHGMVLERGWIYHPTVSLPAALGIPLYATALVGLPAFIARHRTKALLCLAFPATYFAVSGSGYAVFLRYSLPLVPFLCLSAAVPVEWIAERLGGKATRRRALAAGVLTLAIATPSALRVWRTNTLLTERDNRLIAADWVLENLPVGSSIHQAGSRSARLQLPRSFDSLERRMFSVTGHLGRGWMADTLPGRTRGEALGYEEWEWDREADGFVLEGRAVRGRPDYVILMESALPRYERPPGRLLEMLERSYERIESFIAIDLERGGQRFDPIDAFYVPYAGFEGVARPGPNVHVYRKLRGGP